MSTHSYSLSKSSLKDIPFDKYEQDFTFIVNGRRYVTSRIIADILSPIIRKNHDIDPSNNEFTINTSDTQNKQEPGDSFSQFLDLVKFERILISDELSSKFSGYFAAVGNIDELMRIESIALDSEDPNSSIDLLLKLSASGIYGARSDRVTRHVDNVSLHFSEVDRSKLKRLCVGCIEMVVNNSNLKVESEDDLFDFVIEKYEEEPSSGFLFEYVDFRNLSEEKMSDFVYRFDLEDMNAGVWRSICAKLSSTFAEREGEATTKRKKDGAAKPVEAREDESVKTFEYSSGGEFEGIMRHLSRETGGNIHDNGTIVVSTNNLNQGYPPKNVVDYGSDSFYDPGNGNMQNSFVCFDFKERLVQVTDYSIKSYTQRYLRNWSIDVSKDGSVWETVDRHVDDPTLKGANKIGTFSISQPRSEYYRFVRLVETGCRWDDDTCYDGDISMIEFYGQLKEPTSK